MKSDGVPQPVHDDLSRPNTNQLPTLAVTLLTEGVIATKKTSPGRQAPVWTVRFKVTYPASPSMHQKPIMLMTPDLTDVSRYKLQYLLSGEWRDAALGIGCMAGIDFPGPETSELNVGESYGTFASLSPGEVWESSFFVFDLDWECLDENNTGPAGDAFRLQYLGGPLEWWDYGRRGEHKETVVTINAFCEVVRPKENGGRGELVLPPSNVLEASWNKSARK